MNQPTDQPDRPSSSIREPSPTDAPAGESAGGAARASPEVDSEFELEPEAPKLAAPMADPTASRRNAGATLQPPSAESSASAGDGEGEFAAPGRGRADLVATVGGCVLVLAMIAAGAFAPEQSGAGVIAARVSFTALQAGIHTLTGVLAVVIAAWATGHTLGRLELVAARVFAALSLFLLARLIPIPVPYVGVALAWAGGMLLYWLAVALLFKKDFRTAGGVGVLHLAMFVCLELLFVFQGWLRAVAVM